MTRTKTRLLTAGIAIIVLLAAAFFAVPFLSRNAGAEVWTGNIADDFGGGTGAADAPYIIANGEQLAFLAQQVNDYGKTYAGEYFKLTGDIDLDSKEWTPISYGGYDRNDNLIKDTNFAGTFDGAGFTISNLVITENGASKHTGLFGRSSGTIKNLYLDNANIESYNGIGAICAYNSGTIEACGVLSGTLKISANNGGNVGGICENNSGKISKCYNMANIVGGGENGGICASNVKDGGTIEDCYNGGSVAAERGIANAGVCANNSGDISRCFNFGKLGGEGAGGTYYGVCGNGVGTMTDCFNDSTVSDVPVKGFGATTTNVENKTTMELCSEVFNGLGTDRNDSGKMVWYYGGLKASSTDPDFSDSRNSDRFLITEYKYPSLNGISKEVPTAEVKVYCFRNGNDGRNYTADIYTIIETAEEFLAIGNDTTDDKAMWKGNYVLGADIDLKGRDVTPIGNSATPFTGKFSGSGYSIKNAKIEMPNDGCVGLFGGNSGIITDLYVENAQIVGQSIVGGICGRNETNGIINNCAFLGTAQATWSCVGGVCGLNYGTLENCYSIGAGSEAVFISQNGWAGGVCGQNDGTIKTCYSAGTVSGKNYVGSVVGNNSGTVTNCYYDNSVSSVKAIGNNDVSNDDETNNVTGLERDVLCGGSLNGFSGKIWENGSNTIEAVNGSAKLRKITTAYPYLNDVGEAYSVEKYEYNYGTESAEDWQGYTVIKDENEFIEFTKNHDMWSGNYVLGADLDLTTKDFKDFSPIGRSVNNTFVPFTGKFSGGGHTITVAMSADDVSSYGVFGTNKGIIMNLAVKGDISARRGGAVGGICGSNCGTIYGCSFEGTVYCNINGAVGGIAGTIDDGKILNCYTVANVRAENYFAGGICGSFSGTYSEINTCYFAGTVSGAGDGYVGAIIGKDSASGISCYDCYYDNELCNVDNGHGKGVTTEQLCELSGFSGDYRDESIWTKGSYEEQPNGGRFRTLVYTYPSLKDVGAAHSAEREQYNYKTDGADDWQEYTLIKDVNEFIALTETPDMWSGNYVLGADLDLAKKDFSPIGRTVDNKSVPFTGRFSGNGHTITVAMNSDSYDYAYGVFGENNGVIMNLAVKGDIRVEQSYRAGGICGLNNGMIYGCSFEGTVYCEVNGTVGGICGAVIGGKIYDCYAIADVHAASYAGGICGYAANSPYVYTCYFVGNVSSSAGSNDVGAIFGYGNGSFQYCYYDNEVCNVDDEKGDGVTTQKLCELDRRLYGHYTDENIWTKGSYEAQSGGDRFRTVTCTYPSLVEGCEATPVTREQYNFGVGGNDDWQEYTVIENEDQFIALTQTPAMWSGNYVLGRDLNLANKVVSPIGDVVDGELVSFSGKFSGNGHTISNVEINDWFADSESAKKYYAGVFGANSGIIMNLAVNGKVEGDSYVGGICGDNDANGVIYGCSFEGTVTADQYVGGICGTNGYTGGQPKISNCYAIADITARACAGGICGGNYATVEYCYSAGEVNADDGYVYDPVCYNEGGNATSNYCYYNSDLCGSGSPSTKNAALTTQALCGDSLPAGFSADIWGKGSYSMAESGDKFRTVTYTYPSLNGVGEPYSALNELQYNYGYNGSDDWQKCTRITTYEQFAAIGNDSTSNKELWRKNYVLGADIDLGGKATAPIGDSSYSFTGKFSGNGHLFKNAASSLFGSNEGLIEYVTIESGSIGYGPIAGSISVENGSDGVIYACGNNADVTVTTSLNMGAGGIVATNNGVISNCYNTGDVSSKAQAGGLCAVNYGTLEYSYNAGAVSGDNKTDALCIEQNGTLNTCYYNEDCGKSSFGSGLSTMAMTSKVFDGFGSLWVKKSNAIDPESCEGAAYYPSFSEDFAPSEEFTLTLNFVKLGEETPVYGDDIKFQALANIKYANGKFTYFEDGITTIRIDDEIVVENDDIVNGIATYKAKTAGETTFTLSYTNADYFAGEVTKDLVIDIARKNLTAKDFDFTPAADLVFNNKEKTAGVTVKAGMEGVGAITVNYYCDGEKLDSVPINAGDYIVKISVAEGKFYNAAELEDSKWAFTIEKADAPAVPNIELGYNWQTDEDVTVFVPGLPENMGTIEGYTITPAEANGKSFEYSDKKLYFHVGPYTEDKVGSTVLIQTTLSTQNYNDISFLVEVELNNKANRQAPSLDDFELVFTDNAGVITATINTALEGLEYSFDGAYWSSENTLETAHDKLVNAYIRYAATDDMNASAPVSKQANSGHGTLTHHERVEPQCLMAGSIEYWECELCARYFLDEKGENETALDGTIIAAAGHTNGAAVREKEVAATCTADGSYEEVVYCAVCSAEISREQKTIPAAGHKWAEKYESDKRGHWHKCEVCSVDSAVEAHVSNGPATYAEAEVCNICGYEIAPKKNTGGNSGSGSGGSSGGANGGSAADVKPTINGKTMGWSDITKTITGLTSGSEATIDLNGNYDVPADVIKAIADRKIKATLRVDSWRSWRIDGAEITAPAAANLRVITLGMLDTTGLRGTAGYKFSLSGTNNPAALTVAFNKEYAGKFANLYKSVDGKLVFVNNVKVGADGNVTLPDMADNGNYVIMLCEYSDRRGDANNDGIVNIADALALLRDVFGLEEARNSVMRDFNGDGRFDIADARDLLKDVFFSKA